MHGEQLAAVLYNVNGEGSSPYARGTAEQARYAGRLPGIIPVCTGNRPAPKYRRYAAGDHPRMHGEQYSLLRQPDVPVGSSPYARGTAGNDFSRLSGRRIIPVCTGNSIRSISFAASTKDHPRMHGEQEPEVRSVVATQGSSPYARGTAAPCGTCPVRAGIIPVCTGNSQLLYLVRNSPGDHPRMHGEQA